MPGMDGPRLRGVSASDNSDVTLIVDQQGQEKAVATRGCSALTYLVKPVDIDALQSV
jgi:DNA-binding NtrC family response regulator